MAANSNDAGLIIEHLLRRLPKERLVDILLEEVAPVELRNKIASLRSGRPASGDLSRVLMGMTVDQLTILVLETTAMDEERAQHEFLEYRFSERPSLYLRSIVGSILPDRLHLSTLEHNLAHAFEDLNRALETEAVDPPSKGFTLRECREIDGLIEVTYQVRHRFDLVDDDLRPRTEYSAVIGAIWIDAEHCMCLINASKMHDATHLSTAIAQALGVSSVDAITLTPALTEGMVEEENIRTGGFTRAAQDGTGPFSVRFSDIKLADYGSYRQIRDGGQYLPTYGYYRLLTTHLGLARQLGIGLTRSTGRIWIPYSLSRTDLILLARWLMREVSERRAALLVDNLSEAIVTYEEAFRTILSRDRRSGEIRAAIQSLIPPLMQCLRDGGDSAPIDAEPLHLASVLKDELLAITIQGTCEHCNMDRVLSCERCGDSRVSVLDDRTALACLGCGERQDLSAALSAKCECGNTISFDPERGMVLYPSSRLMATLDELLRTVDAELELTRYVFVIVGRELHLLRDRTPVRVLQLADIQEFGQPSDFESYPPRIRSIVDQRVSKGSAGKEKCAGVRSDSKGRTTYPCDACSPQDHPDRECLRTVVIDRIGSGKIEPHAGTEVADLPFDVTVDGRQRKVLAFAKRVQKGELRLKNGPGQELLAQVWQWHNSDSFEVIAILCNCPIAQDLRLAIEGMARYGRKSVLYIDGEAVKRLLAENISAGTDKGPKTVQ